MQEIISLAIWFSYAASRFYPWGTYNYSIPSPLWLAFVAVLPVYQQIAWHILDSLSHCQRSQPRRKSNRHPNLLLPRFLVTAVVPDWPGLWQTISRLLSWLWLLWCILRSFDRSWSACPRSWIDAICHDLDRFWSRIGCNSGCYTIHILWSEYDRSSDRSSLMQRGLWC